MNRKNKTFVSLLIAIMLALQVMPAYAQDETPPPGEVSISIEPSTEDENWTIINKETRTRKDPSTGKDIVETIVVRQQPTKNRDCIKNKVDQINIGVSSACTFSISIQLSSTVYVGGGAVTGYVTAFADKYCNTWNGECDYVKMKKVQVYWTRTSTSFGVINARSYMGCNNPYCLVCSSGIVTTGYMFRSTSFNVSWSGLRSLTYTSTAPTNIPIMKVFLEQGGYPIAGNDSTATAPRSTYFMANYVVFAFP
jgi:hypothetical protein